MGNVCDVCGKKGTWREPLIDGRICADCMKLELAGRAVEVTQEPVIGADIILTTETAHNLPVVARLDIVTAEVVIGMHLFKDIAVALRDIFGGRSETMQRGLREARLAALSELRAEAHGLGADAVVGVKLDYCEIGSDSRSMLLLVASGTAVRLAPPSPNS